MTKPIRWTDGANLSKPSMLSSYLHKLAVIPRTIEFQNTLKATRHRYPLWQQTCDTSSRQVPSESMHSCNTPTSTALASLAFHIREQGTSGHLSRCELCPRTPSVGEIPTSRQLNRDMKQAYQPPILFFYFNDRILAPVYKCNGYSDTTFRSPQYESAQAKTNIPPTFSTTTSS